MSAGSGLPTGTATFVFTDVEGSTRLAQELGDRYGDVIAAHETILREAIAGGGGRVIDTQGDSFFAAFPLARDAVTATVAMQRALAEHDWPGGGAVRVRIGLHTGEAAVAEVRYVGVPVHRAARICAAGHGGQILLSNTTRELVEDALPEGIELRDLGEQRLKDLARPERLFQVVADGLGADFPPLRGLDQQEAALLPTVRASDADRERVAVALREHTVAGRLTLDEFVKRLDLAYAARTEADLEPLMRDLPDLAAAAVPPAQRRKPKRFTVAIFGGADRKGRWRVGLSSYVFTMFGGSDLDLRHAEIDGPVVTITAITLFGGSDFYVPEGVDVDLSGFAIFGGNDEHGGEADVRPDAPLVRVRAYTLFGGTDVWRVPREGPQLSARELKRRKLPPGLSR